MSHEIDYYHGDEQILEAERQEELEQYEQQHQDDWKGEVND